MQNAMKRSNKVRQMEKYFPKSLTLTCMSNPFSTRISTKLSHYVTNKHIESMKRGQWQPTYSEKKDICSGSITN